MVRRVQRPFDVALVLFVVLADVEQRDVLRPEPLGEAFDVSAGVERVSGSLAAPGADAAGDVAAEDSEPDRLEQAAEAARVVVARCESGVPEVALAKPAAPCLIALLRDRYEGVNGRVSSAGGRSRRQGTAEEGTGE